MTMYFFWPYDSYLTLIKSDQVRGPKLDTYPVFFWPRSEWSCRTSSDFNTTVKNQRRQDAARSDVNIRRNKLFFFLIPRITWSFIHYLSPFGPSAVLGACCCLSRAHRRRQGIHHECMSVSSRVFTSFPFILTPWGYFKKKGKHEKKRKKHACFWTVVQVGTPGEN